MLVRKTARDSIYFGHFLKAQIDGLLGVDSRCPWTKNDIVSFITWLPLKLNFSESFFFRFVG